MQRALCSDQSTSFLFHWYFLFLFSFTFSSVSGPNVNRLISIYFRSVYAHTECLVAIIRSVDCIWATIGAKNLMLTIGARVTSRYTEFSVSLFFLRATYCSRSSVKPLSTGFCWASSSVDSVGRNEYNRYNHWSFRNDTESVLLVSQTQCNNHKLHGKISGRGYYYYYFAKKRKSKQIELSTVDVAFLFITPIISKWFYESNKRKWKCMLERLLLQWQQQQQRMKNTLTQLFIIINIAIMEKRYHDASGEQTWTCRRQAAWACNTKHSHTPCHAKWIGMHYITIYIIYIL